MAVSVEDSRQDLEWMARKIVELRVFDDADGRLNLSLLDVGGQLLVVSQFTLFGDCSKGRRPSFIEAAPPDKGRVVYEYFIQELKKHAVAVATGTFGAMMEVELVNDGPVTLILEK